MGFTTRVVTIGSSGSIENYGKYFFNGHVMDFTKYIDCGFVIVNESHRDFFTQVTDFITKMFELLRRVEKNGAIWNRPNV